VAYFERPRSQLISRRSELARRIAAIEADLDLRGASKEPSTADEVSADHSLDDFMDTLRRELGVIESAIRRIDSREYDCCMQCGGRIRPDRLELLPYAVNCARCSRSFPREYVQQLRGQHSDLRRALVSLETLITALIERCEEQTAGAGNLAPTLALLADLSRQLPEHFALEEKGGYLAEALQAAPRFSRRAERLQKQHRGFGDRIESILEEANLAATSSKSWRRVDGHFRQFSTALMAHEQAENDILESAFLDDIGTAD